LPQKPQSLMVVLRFTHEPKQFVKPKPPHWGVHRPPEHTEPGGQEIPQPPQLFRLDAKSTHWPKHVVGS
jgi:hypothetical protein